MKNLKRILCLVMVFALCAGLVTVAANAADYDSFPDTADVTYKEAMETLVAIGVIDGIDGKLDPAGYVTREQAAKMIAYMCLGKTAANALSTSSTVFGDVETGRWSAGYIAYCASKGIINGVGDTNGDGLSEFNPSGNVTANEFMKMLLCAIGYGVNSEFTGSAWSANVDSVAADVNGFDDTKATNYDAAATREEAMLYAFNILTGAMMVNYSGVFGSYYSGSNVLSPVTTDDETWYEYTLGYKTFGLSESDTDVDDFGRAYHTWDVDGDAVTGEFISDPAASYTGITYSGTVYSAIGSKYAGMVDHYYIDGVDMIDNGVLSDTVTKNEGKITRADTSNYFGGRGVQTFVYTTSSTKSVTIVEINTYLGIVDSVDEDEGTVTLTIYSGTANDGGDSYTYSADDVSAFSEDEYVLATLAIPDDGTSDITDATVETLTAAKSVSGTATAYAGSYTSVDGTTYYRGYKYLLDEASDKDDYSSTYTFYLDSYGYIIGAVMEEEAATSLDYVYVSDSYGSAYGAIGGDAYVKAAVTFMDGTSGVVNVYVKNAGKSTATYYDGSAWTKVSAVDGDDAFNAGFYSYTKTSGGYYTLTDLNGTTAVAATAADINDSSAKVTFTKLAGGTATKYATSSTKLVVLDAGVSYTGYSSFPDVEDLGLGDSYAVLYVLNSSGTLSGIYIYGDSDIGSTVTFAYFYAYSYSTSDGYYYKLYVDGKAQLYLFSGLQSGFSKGDVVSIETDSDGYSTITGVESDGYTVVTGETVSYADTGYFETESGANMYYLGDDDTACEVMTSPTAWPPPPWRRRTSSPSSTRPSAARITPTRSM